MDNGRFQTSFVYSLLKSLILVGMTFLIFMIMEDGSYTSEFVMGKADAPHEPAQRYTQIFSLLSHNSRSKHRYGALCCSSQNICCLLSVISENMNHIEH